jgi:patatin-like phospholipase/acyl hydrolase
MKLILSIDGGGIRGLIAALICQRIEKALDAPLCKVFDLIAGTSTGGIIALGLAKPPTL